MNIRLTILVFFSLISFSLFAQRSSDLIPGEMVIRFESKTAFQQFLENRPEILEFSKKASESLQVYLFKYDPASVDAEALANTLNRNRLILAAGQNFQVHKRATIPSDEFFGDQNSFDLIDAPDAWDINTSAPEEVVVAVIEGADINHEDLKDNIWTNPNEIPDDGIDNDNNGYIDDYWGVNVADSTDNPVVDDHGTSVAGIIGAKGDNDIGVAGMLWEVNMMIVSSNLTYTQIIESYDYVYNMRKRYNDTNGAEGAFVVTTNASFGVDNAYPSQNVLFPIWCDMYDMLGSVGVLSAAATTNNKVDIGSTGDIPGLCSSEYLITVTETNLSDELKAAYNPIHVDLAAPGQSFTTDLNDSYSIFNGTSAATPVVTGAVAMMYSYPCKNFQEQSATAPAQTALIVKDILMESVDSVEELANMTVSGGRLNMFSAMQGLQTEFGNQIGDLGFINIYPNPVHETLFIEYRTSEVSDYDLKIYDALGRLVYHHFIPELCAPRIIEVPVNRFAAGMYFMSIENINNIESTSFWVY